MRVVLFIIVSLAVSVAAWDDDDLEVFDAVDEVNQNFYELIGVALDASQQEIKSAFKKLTLKLHPDKNDAPDADVQFRNLVTVHNILKDPGKREKYNEVLKNGLPNWRSAVYYYRHVRKMGLAESSLIVFIIVTFGQYAVSWAAYAEKRYTAEQILTSRVNRKQKKSGFDTGLAEILEKLPKPSVKDTLPFQIPRIIWWSLMALPYAVMDLKRHLKEKKEEAIRLKKEEEEDKLRVERELQAAREARALRAAGGGGGARRRKGFVPTERECLLAPGEEPDAQPREAARPAPVLVGGLWTDDDFVELTRLVKKYPGGTPERWERIAEAMCRAVQEVTHMAAKLKDNCYKVPGHETCEPPPPEPPKKVKTRAEDAPGGGGGGAWSQAQQQALEGALARHPKGGAGDRWAKIAGAVHGKTKEECMQRCKYLSDMVKRQKQKEEEDQQRETENVNGDDVNNDSS